jgi:hypothetical protein
VLLSSERSLLDSRKQASAWALISPNHTCACCWFCRRLDKSTWKVLLTKSAHKIFRQVLPQKCWQTPKYVPRRRKGNKNTHNTSPHTTHQLPYPSSPSPITAPLIINHGDPKHYTPVTYFVWLLSLLCVVAICSLSPLSLPLTSYQGNY